MACGLFHLMEDFILKEVDYSQKYGYSSRARRYMKRKLNKELAPFIEDEEDDKNEENDKNEEDDKNELESSSEYDSKYDTDDTFNESIMIPKKCVEVCFFISYVSVILTIYGVTLYITRNYSNYSNECNHKS